ncbi:unnamed protein product [Effrenium voratum]|uniref:beta-glucosidase n=1 Tax=Effrenium voratum TaxID=2562239 RepID=A0AA36I0K5_9DINO|nr:unnamed protein product [Effrenium voratum]
MATSQEHVELARSIASQGAVLLKNDKVSQDGAPVLPLLRSQKIAIIGEACGVAPDIDHESKTWTDASYFSIGGSSRVLSKDDLTLMDGMSRYGATTQICLEDDFAGVNKALSGADVAIVCAGSTSTESADRTTLRLDQDALVDEVLRQGNEMKVPVVVLLLTAGVVVMPWSQAATGILLMFPSGQATGLAAADLLFGAVHPSGKLPVTIPAKEEDAMRPCIESACPYEEKLFVGWHLYDGRDVAYPFGFGLTYTSFEYLPGEMSDEQESGAKSLHVTVKNVGEQPGREILQLYLRFPTTVPEIQQEPATQLRGFHRTRLLQPGEAEEVVFKVGPGDMMVWEMQEDDWTMVYGRYSVGIGASSRDLRLCGVFFHQLGVTKAQGVPLGPCPQREFLLSADGR